MNIIIILNYKRKAYVRARGFSSTLRPHEQRFDVFQGFNAVRLRRIEMKYNRQLPLFLVHDSITDGIVPDV